VESLWGDKWIIHPSLVIIAAEPKTGKSILTMDMLAAFADPSRLEFLGGATPGSKRVLYLNEEVHQPGVYERVQKLFGSEGAIWEGNYFINSIRGIRLDCLPHNRLAELVTECKADVVAIDPIARYHSWTEDNIHMGILLNEVLWPVVRSGTTVIVVHHFNKMQNADTRHAWARIRGGTRLVADPDSIFSMVSDDDSSLEVEFNAQLRHGPWAGKRTLYRWGEHDLHFHLEPAPLPNGAELAADRPTRDIFLTRLGELHTCNREEAIKHANALLFVWKKVRIANGYVEMI
jgi:RecA-family ATPase